MTLTSDEEERALKKFDRAFWKGARRAEVADYTREDCYQEAKLAALVAIRKYDPSKGNTKLSTWVIEAINLRMRQLYWLYRRDGHRKINANCLSLDEKLSKDEPDGDTHLDRLPSLLKADWNMMQMACEALCSSELEVAIVEAVATGDSLADVGRIYGLTRSRIGQIKERLFARIREEIAL